MIREIDRNPMPVRRLPVDHHRSLLEHLRPRAPHLLLGPQVGQDAAVIDVGDRYLVGSTDSITFATDQHQPLLHGIESPRTALSVAEQSASQSGCGHAPFQSRLRRGARHQL